MKCSNLPKLYNSAIKKIRQKQYKYATDELKAICMIQPDYECGYAYYNLARALHKLEKCSDASNAYLAAIKQDSKNEIFWGGYASFLFLHGNPQEAFNAYLQLYRIERENMMNTDDTLIGIKELAQQLKLSDAELKKRLKNLGTG